MKPSIQIPVALGMLETFQSNIKRTRQHGWKRIFSDLVTKLDRKFPREKWNVFLIDDNCGAHDQDITTKLTSIKLEFLPPNCTSQLHPYHMGIIRHFKVLYQKHLFSKLIRTTEENSKEGFTVNVLECLRWSKSVWGNGVAKKIISNCFKKAGFQRNSTKVKASQRILMTWTKNNLADLQFIKSDDRHLLHDFISVNDKLETSPVLSNTDIAKGIRDMRQIEKIKVMLTVYIAISRIVIPTSSFTRTSRDFSSNDFANLLFSDSWQKSNSLHSLLQFVPITSFMYHFLSKLVDNYFSVLQLMTVIKLIAWWIHVCGQEYTICLAIESMFEWWGIWSIFFSTTHSVVEKNIGIGKSSTAKMVRSGNGNVEYYFKW